MPKIVDEVLSARVVLSGRREEGMERGSRFGRWTIPRRQCRIQIDVEKREVSGEEKASIPECRLRR
jgi:hypothetical protein